MTKILFWKLFPLISLCFFLSLIVSTVSFLIYQELKCMGIYILNSSQEQNDTEIKIVGRQQWEKVMHSAKSVTKRPRIDICVFYRIRALVIIYLLNEIVFVFLYKYLDTKCFIKCVWAINSILQKLEYQLFSISLFNLIGSYVTKLNIFH